MHRFLTAALIFLVLACPASAVTVTVAYAPSDQALVNPFIGNAAWAGDPAPRQQPFTLVYANLRWADFEPQPGEYDFEGFEAQNHFDKWRAEGKRLILRFVMDLPGKKKHLDIPGWLYDLTGDGKFYKVDYGSGYCPDYDNPVLMDAHRRAIAALGAHYDGDSFVAYVELGSLGHWGEWHIHEKAGKMPEESVRDQYAQAYADAFKTVRLMMRRPFRFAAENGFGLYNDTSGEPGATLTWLDWIASGGEYDETGENSLVRMPDAWRDAPVGGELSTSMTMRDLLGDNLDRTISLFESCHTSWIGPGSFVDVPRDGPLQAALDRLNRTVGYRLLVSSARLDASEGKAELSVTWQNDGNAPFYFGWTPCLRLTDSAGAARRIPLELNLQEVLPGAPVTVDVDLDGLTQGEYEVEVAIPDPETGTPGVLLAMDSKIQSGWYLLMSFSL